MCGRFYLDVQADELKEILHLSDLPDDLHPRYNIAPSQPVLAVVAEEGSRVARWFRWGLIPAWAKDEKFGYRTINARAETVAEKPAFRSAFRRHRCLIPASGYFEWRAESGGKQPYRIRPAGKPLLVFAGLYEYWQGPQGTDVDSCTILVTDATPTLARIHDRMPVCLGSDQFDTWLDPVLQEPAQLQRLIDSPAVSEMEIHPVTRRMNNPRYDGPEAIIPVQVPRQ